jgi:hypothetical protein
VPFGGTCTSRSRIPFEQGNSFERAMEAYRGRIGGAANALERIEDTCASRECIVTSRNGGSQR